MSTDFSVTARAYLLGELPDEHATALEQSLLTSPDTLDQVEEIEHDLVDGYVDGRLSGPDRTRFEQHYLASTVHRERVAFVRALGQLPGDGVNAVDVVPVRSARAWPRMIGWAAAAALALGVAGWLSLRSTPVTAPSRPDAPRVAEAPQAPSTADVPAVPPAAPAVSVPTRVALVLAPVVTRSSTTTPRLVIPAGTRVVDLQLQGDRTHLARAAAEIRSVDDSLVWTGRSAPTVADASAPYASIVTVPADRLVPDDYILTIADADGQALARYFFRVARDR